MKSSREPTIREFYEKQHRWSGAYCGSVSSFHRNRAASILLPHRDPPYRVLELGCGGGQLAVALAELGHAVTAIDLVPDAIETARRLATACCTDGISFIEGDFYTIEFRDRFDVICYFDGFGIGSDADQKCLLGRVASWLAEDGVALIEIYTPWYWEQQAGTIMQWPDATRQYDFDKEGQRMLDTWWPTGNPAAAVTQSLRCYAPDKFEQLLLEVDLVLASIEPGGAVNRETGQFRDQVPLAEAMQYVAVLSHAERASRSRSSRLVSPASGPLVQRNPDQQGDECRHE